MDAPTPEPQRVTALDLDLTIRSVLRATGLLAAGEIAAVAGLEAQRVQAVLERMRCRGAVHPLPGIGRASSGLRAVTLWVAAPDAN